MIAEFLITIGIIVLCTRIIFVIKEAARDK